MPLSLKNNFVKAKNVARFFLIPFDVFDSHPTLFLLQLFFDKVCRVPCLPVPVIDLRIFREKVRVQDLGLIPPGHKQT